ncbi:hypothetical protein [Mucilaginibacter sp. UYCu711]|uniref:hypothetical protein n=1 Tax=Mucilaginibacter sp. UYCu711 TaxID=3156339 RepID=UPI003D198896
MKITITEPAKNKTLNLEAIPESYIGGCTWRIEISHEAPFIVSQETGVWTVIGRTNINPELINQIGIALHPIARYTSFNS